LGFLRVSEPLIEIVNPSQQGHWNLRDYEKRVTEVEVSPRAGKRLSKIVL
jgi:hypothetical protein